MKKVKVTEIKLTELIFNNGVKLVSDHEQDCCETHFLSFGDLEMSDFDVLEFDLSNDNFFNRINDYGIELVPIYGHTVKIPGYGSNNGYYSSAINLVIIDANDKVIKSYDVSNCQKITEY